MSVKRTFSIDETKNSHLTSFGLGSWRPKWAQRLAHPLVFVGNLCLVNIFQLMGASVLFGAISTLEKRYAFSATITATILISELVLIAVLSPIAGYYAVRFNRSRLIATGQVISACAALSICLPFFIYGPATHLLAGQNGVQFSNSTSSNYDFCSTTSSTDCLEETTTSTSSSNTVWPAVIMLLLGNCFCGVGAVCYFTIATPFIDDNVPKRKAPFYISLMHGINLVGRLLGFFLSSYTLSFYEAPWIDPGIDASDPRWVGAWWLGYFTAGSLAILASIPLFFFPGEFKTASVKSEEIQKEIEESGYSFGDAFKRFITNPLLILYFFGNEFRYIGETGFFTYMAKYFETQYRITSSSASAISGATGFAPIILGLIVGGGYVSYFKPKARLLFTIIFLTEMVSVFTIGSGLFLGCDPVQLQGDFGVNGFDLSTDCNTNCNCSTRVYSPICGSDLTTTYFSPCHAGCSSYNESTSTFEHCSCFSGSATSGHCPVDSATCTTLTPYLILLTIGTFISSTAIPGNSLIAFRSVLPADKTFTTGLLSASIMLLSFMPGELLYGYIVDSSCLIWETKCGRRGNCWIYNQEKFRMLFLGISTAFIAIGSLFDFIIIFYADRMKSIYGEVEEKAKEVKKLAQ